MASREKAPGQRGCRGGSRVPARPGQRTALAWSRGRTGKDELEGQPEAAPGSWLKGPGPQLRPSGRGREQAGLRGMGRGQGRTVSPRAPAAHGVPAGLELQAYPGEKGTKSCLRGGASMSIRGWRDPPPNNSKPGSQPRRPGVPAETGAAPGRDSPSCLLGRCPQGDQCLRGIPGGKQRAGVTHRRREVLTA